MRPVTPNLRPRSVRHACAVSLAAVLLTLAGPPGSVARASDPDEHPLAHRRFEAATTRPTKLGLAGPFFALYPQESCGQTELGNAVFLYTCHVGGRPQQFQLDLAIPGIVVLTAVSLNGETPNLGASLDALAAELGVAPTAKGGRAAPKTAAGAAATATGPVATPLPPYVGAWGVSQEACGELYEFYVNTVIGRRRIQQGFRTCTINASSPIGSTHVLALTCEDPGDPEIIETLARLTIETPDRITYERADQPRESLERCRGPIPDEVRAVIDE